MSSLAVPDFAQYWLLVLAVLLRGGVVYGGTVLGLYGLGRALSVAAVPPLLDRSVALLEGLQAVRAYRPSLHRWHGYGLLVLALGLTARGVFLR